MEKATLRLMFTLPQEDQDYLKLQGWQWETIGSGNQQWLLIHNWPLPAGFSTKHTDLALLITQGYPTAPLDMAYFNPDLVLEGGRSFPPNTRLSATPIDGKNYQRWSKHRQAGTNEWRPGIDSIRTHLLFITAFLADTVSGNSRSGS